MLAGTVWLLPLAAFAAIDPNVAATFTPSRIQLSPGDTLASTRFESAAQSSEGMTVIATPREGRLPGRPPTDQRDILRFPSDGDYYWNMRPPVFVARGGILRFEPNRTAVGHDYPGQIPSDLDRKVTLNLFDNSMTALGVPESAGQPFYDNLYANYRNVYNADPDNIPDIDLALQMYQLGYTPPAQRTSTVQAILASQRDAASPLGGYGVYTSVNIMGHATFATFGNLNPVLDDPERYLGFGGAYGFDMYPGINLADLKKLDIYWKPVRNTGFGEVVNVGGFHLNSCLQTKVMQPANRTPLAAAPRGLSFTPTVQGLSGTIRATWTPVSPVSVNVLGHQITTNKSYNYKVTLWRQLGGQREVASGTQTIAKVGKETYTNISITTIPNTAYGASIEVSDPVNNNTAWCDDVTFTTGDSPITTPTITASGPVNRRLVSLSFEALDPTMYRFVDSVGLYPPHSKSDPHDPIFYYTYAVTRDDQAVSPYPGESGVRIAGGNLLFSSPAIPPVVDDLKLRPGTYTYRLSVSAPWTSTIPAPASTGPVANPRPAQVVGFADLHVHQTAELADGGSVFGGRAGDGLDGSIVRPAGATVPRPMVSGKGFNGGLNTWANGSVSDYGLHVIQPPLLSFDQRVGNVLSNDTGSALADCGSWYASYHNASALGGLASLADAKISLLMDTISPIIETGMPLAHGYPDFEKWPGLGTEPAHSEIVALHRGLHQQVYKAWLKRAWQGGLRTMSMLARNSEFLCKLIASAKPGVSNGKSPISCDDGESIAAQIDAAYRLQAEIDEDDGCLNPASNATPNSSFLPFDGGAPTSPATSTRNCGWYRIVNTPEGARDVINHGQLAVILGTEVDTALGCGTQLTGSWGGGDATKWDNTSGLRSRCAVSDLTNPNTANTVGSLMWLYNRGVRHIFPIHLIDNGIGHSAINDDLWNIANYRMNGRYLATQSGSETCLGFNAGLAPSGDWYPNIGFRLPSFSATSVDPFVKGFGTALGLGVIFTLPSYTNPGTEGNCNRGQPSFDASGAAQAAEGLTPDGLTVMAALKTKGMIIDFDHMSKRASADAALALKGYPHVNGHTGIAEAASWSQYVSERDLDPEEIEDLVQVGGLIGIGLAGELKTAAVAETTPGMTNNIDWLVHNYAPYVPGNGVTLNCNGSVRTMAQHYLKAIDSIRPVVTSKKTYTGGWPLDPTAYTTVTQTHPRKPLDVTPSGSVVAVAFGSDFNTMSSMVAPRFGHEACNGAIVQAQSEVLTSGAVMYDVDVDAGGFDSTGLGGIRTTIPANPATGFPGFTGPRLARSLINPNGNVLVAFSSDNALGAGPLCLDYDLDLTVAPKVRNCRSGNVSYARRSQQFAFERVTGSLPEVRIRAKFDTNWNDTAGGQQKCLTLNASSAISFIDCDSSNDAQKWVMLPSGRIAAFSQIVSGAMNCLSAGGTTDGSSVVMEACSASNVRQVWARGGEFESINRSGLRHIGLYPDFIEEMRAVGMTNGDLEPLFNSAEGFLQMWERIQWTK